MGGSFENVPVQYRTADLASVRNFAIIHTSRM